MKHLFFVLVMFTVTTVSNAECYESISQGKDSVFYQVLASEVDFDNAAVEKVAKAALKKVLDKLGCGEVSINDLSCRQISKEQKNSKACYAQSEVGYFVMNKDELGNVNIIFNRFD